MMKYINGQLMVRFLGVILVTFATFASADSAPILRFSDLTNGPATGLNDGVGSGSIVTIWGQHLGSNNSAELRFVDSSGKSSTPHIYYWKDADGALPGGPADLYSSHRMQEIAFSIPAAAAGMGKIRITRDGKSSELPFLVRSGRIYHVKANGSDSASGSFGSPFATAAHAVGELKAGDTVYVHDSISELDDSRLIYANRPPASVNNQYAIVAYPGSQPVAESYQRVVATYNTAGFVIAKYTVRTGNRIDIESADPEAGFGEGGVTGRTSWGIQGSNDGRIVANRITDIEGRCPNSFQGAIVTGAGGSESELNTRSSNLKILGNYIHDFGCPQSDRFIHTTYISTRNYDSFDPEPFEFAWNRLDKNHTRNGIHIYDENIGNGGGPCASYTGDVLIHGNVVSNQRAAGFALGANCANNISNDWLLFNNVFINTGTGLHFPGNSNNLTHAIFVSDGGLSGNLKVFGNTVYRWGETDEVLNGLGGIQSAIGLRGGNLQISVITSGNVFVTPTDRAFIGTPFRDTDMLSRISGQDNVWFGPSSAETALVPNFDTNPHTDDPGLTTRRGDSILSVSGQLPMWAPVDKPSQWFLFDIYGNSRPTNTRIGAIADQTAVNESIPRPPVLLTGF